MRVRWTEPAIDDLTAICGYIDSHSGGSAARHVALSIHREIDLLSTFPEFGRTGRKAGTRELVFSPLPYIAIYRIHLDSVEIPRILHGARRWP